MHKPEFVLENEMHKILLDFDIQTDHLISARRLDLVIMNKKKREKRNVALDWILPFQLITKWKWKKEKKDRST